MLKKLQVFLPFFLIVLVLAAMPKLEQGWTKYNPITGSWNQDTILYYNSSEYKTSLEAAFQQWEETGIPIDFKETKDENKADLWIFSDEKGLRDKCSDKKCSGWATIGYSPLRRAEIWLLPPTHSWEEEVQDVRMIQTIVHEIGHVLGLGHNDQLCSVMNSYDKACRSLSRPHTTSEGRFMLCGPWEEDLDNLRQIYPEVSTDFSGWCNDPAATKEFFAKKNRESFLILQDYYQAEIKRAFDLLVRQSK